MRPHVLPLLLCLSLLQTAAGQDTSLIELTHPRAGHTLARMSGPAFERTAPTPPLTRFAPPLSPLDGSELIIGDAPFNEHLVITGPFEFEGTIIILNQGHLEFDQAEARIRGSFVIVDDGRLDVRGGSLTFESSFLYQHSSIILQRGVMDARDTRIDYVGGRHGMYVTDDASLLFETVESNGQVTTTLDGQARLRFDAVDKAGEFVVLGENQVIFSNTGLIILWLTFGEGTVADLSLPDGASVPYFRYPELPYVSTDPTWRVTLRQCSNVVFTVMTEAGCDLTLRDSMVRALGFLFEEQHFALDGIVNGQHFAAYEVPLPDRHVALIDAGVETWNAYSMGRIGGAIDQCILGEVLVMGGHTQITDTIVDGTGGYISAMGGSLATVLLSSIMAPITVREDSIMVLGLCGAPLGEIRVDTGGTFLAVQTPLRVRPVVTDLGISAIGWLDALVDPKVDGLLELTGTAVFDAGPDWPDDLASWTVDYASDDQPDAWQPIAVGFSEVWSDALGTWDTQGLPPGGYMLRMTFTDTASNSIEVFEALDLEP